MELTQEFGGTDMPGKYEILELAINLEDLKKIKKGIGFDDVELKIVDRNAYLQLLKRLNDKPRINEIFIATTGK